MNSRMKYFYRCIPLIAVLGAGCVVSAGYVGDYGYDYCDVYNCYSDGYYPSYSVGLGLGYYGGYYGGHRYYYGGHRYYGGGWRGAGMYRGGGGWHGGGWHGGGGHGGGGHGHR
jgi:hypothetical protein